MHHEPSFAGYTMPELLVTTAIVSILALVSLPSLVRLAAASRVNAQAYELLSDINLARNEAVKRGNRVTVCKSPDGVNCTSEGRWDQGWIVFEESRHEDAAVDQGEQLLIVRGRLAGGTVAEGTGGAGSPMRSYVSFNALGFSEQVNGLGQSGTIRLCASGRGVRLVLLRTGRMRAEKVACP